MRTRAAAIPLAIRVVMVVALLNGLTWAVLIPPFQTADETAHVAYVQHLAETGERPLRADTVPEPSSEQRQVLAALGTETIVGRPFVPVPRGDVADAQADAAIEAARTDAPRDDGGGRSIASSQPPLSYALYVAPYAALSWASLPTRILGMRLVSVLLFALTAGLVALLMLELLPGRSWAPLVGGLAVALQPSWTQSLTSVNPDALLATASAALALALIGAVRHGLTQRRALALGAILGVGVLTKLTFAPLAVVGALALLALASRDRVRLSPVRALGGAALAGAVPILLALVYIGVSGGELRPVGRGVAFLPAEDLAPATLRELLSYSWQLYFPRLPGMTQLYAGSTGPELVWLNGLIGRYGWLDTAGPAWLYDVGRTVVLVALALLVATLVGHRRELGRRLPEVVLLGALFGALAAAIAKSGYDYRRGTGGQVFEQVRYLVPVAGLYGGAWALACLGLGARRAPVLAAVAIGIFCAHDLSGMLVVTERYYL